MTEVVTLPCGAPREEEPGRWRLTRHADVVAAFADPALRVPQAGDGDGGLARFRRSVSRFTNGAAHAARRSTAVRELARVEAGALRDATRERAGAALAGGGPVDVMPLARRVPVSVLALALGVPPDRVDEVAALVPVVSAGYPTGVAGPDADEAVDRLAGVIGGPWEEFVPVAVHLVQGCDATAGLIGNTLAHGVDGPADRVVAETLRWDPPVRAAVRLAAEATTLGGAAIPAGATALLDLAAANRDPAVFDRPDAFDPDRDSGGTLTFGAAPRPCPGEEIALELATGFVQAAGGRRVVDVAFGPPGNLRAPARLVLG